MSNARPKRQKKALSPSPFGRHRRCHLVCFIDRADHQKAQPTASWLQIFLQVCRRPPLQTLGPLQTAPLSVCYFNEIGQPTARHRVAQASHSSDIVSVLFFFLNSAYFWNMLISAFIADCLWGPWAPSTDFRIGPINEHNKQKRCAHKLGGSTVKFDLWRALGR